MSVVQCSILRLYAPFTLEKGKIKISNVTLLYCYCPFVLSAKRGFSVQKFLIGTQKKCPLLGGVR